MEAPATNSPSPNSPSPNCGQSRGVSHKSFPVGVTHESFLLPHESFPLYSRTDDAQAAGAVSQAVEDTLTCKETKPQRQSLYIHLHVPQLAASTVSDVP